MTGEPEAGSIKAQRRSARLNFIAQGIRMMLN